MPLTRRVLKPENSTEQQEITNVIVRENFLTLQQNTGRRDLFFCVRFAHASRLLLSAYLDSTGSYLIGIYWSSSSSLYGRVAIVVVAI